MINNSITSTVHDQVILSNESDQNLQIRSSGSQKQPHHYKDKDKLEIIVVGDGTVGKTDLYSHINMENLESLITSFPMICL
jgi:hypothetical protein